MRYHYAKPTDICKEQTGRIQNTEVLRKTAVKELQFYRETLQDRQWLVHDMCLEQMVSEHEAGQE